MSDQTPYKPPTVWQWNDDKADEFKHLARHIAGPTHDKALPVGNHPLQLYSLASANGIKVTILLEELLAAGYADAEYDAWPIRPHAGEQFSTGMLDINPNAKIPALLDLSVDPPQRVFESGAILLYLAEKFDAFVPTDQSRRTETLSWLFWQMASSPYLGGAGLGLFWMYAPEKLEWPINRFAMEVKRQLHVLDRQLSSQEFLVGDTYTIADIAVWPWYGALVRGELFDVAEFLQVQDYSHVKRWADSIAGRPAVGRGWKVNRVWGDPADQLHERHSASDFDQNTQDKNGT